MLAIVGGSSLWRRRFRMCGYEGEERGVCARRSQWGGLVPWLASAASVRWMEGTERKRSRAITPLAHAYEKVLAATSFRKAIVVHTNTPRHRQHPRSHDHLIGYHKHGSQVTGLCLCLCLQAQCTRRSISQPRHARLFFFLCTRWRIWIFPAPSPHRRRRRSRSGRVPPTRPYRSIPRA
jgi:hypothetical protein